MHLVVIIAALVTMSRHIPGSERSAWYASLLLTPEAILPGGRHFILLPPVGKPAKGGPGSVLAVCLLVSGLRSRAPHHGAASYCPAFLGALYLEE